MIVLNLKTYERSLKDALFFTDVVSEVVEETGVRIIIAPPIPYLKESAERYSDVFSQHADGVKPGAHTGSIPPALLNILGVRGSLINHSEKRIPMNEIKSAVEELHLSALESLVCAETIEEMKEIAQFEPTYIAIEPKELIGSGISVSNAKPEIVENSVKEIKQINEKIKVLCGAGISNKEDIENAFKLGAEGVLLASAFVKSKDPKEFLRDLASVF